MGPRYILGFLLFLGGCAPSLEYRVERIEKQLSGSDFRVIWAYDGNDWHLWNLQRVDTNDVIYIPEDILK